MAIYRLLSIVLISVFPLNPALSEEKPVDPNSECSEVLSSQAFQEIDWDVKFVDYAELQSDGTFGALIGLKCSSDEIIDFMQAAGWVLDLNRKGPLSSRTGPVDHAMKFCAPSRGIRRLIGARCEGSSVIYFNDGRLTWIATNGVI